MTQSDINDIYNFTNKCCSFEFYSIHESILEIQHGSNTKDWSNIY